MSSFGITDLNVFSVSFQGGEELISSLYYDTVLICRFGVEFARAVKPEMKNTHKWKIRPAVLASEVHCRLISTLRARYHPFSEVF